ncbi:hypothetical protein F441_18694 [Phytophthora nicotianae CJ01A1]|uniref:Transmembrane protein 107 n=6 Tax=Phytophthora nicotianae TaxID=4792 RepID=W2QVF0_PHYN3|nr:hypothetical protein PPTG_05004 [Phytophthora nicotianae INRA-310]ETI34666.1 hypothetical protein F443_18851 [Phytophthora nicotianae P1569]ETK75013.1 hypothetical protein L915_18313 [Phytophthora nicotianae]ETO63464.1 hypothetical protein F444_18840 [Phytophthora nicotianae P1976]ETP04566.1 hypothetical protein F441_18694 [Phytophthora nicotianae CJ01A1]ETP32691.1 hypothetical protein F442_18667 [Phytophthora nicotianae P10297]
MPKFYGAARWAPKLILLQMLAMQCSHYVAQGLVLGICHGAHVTLDQFFAYHTQTVVTVDGLKNCFAIVAASFVRSVTPKTIHLILRLIYLFCSAVCLALFVERAKKCLDFGVTLYFIDFLAQCFYSEFPKMWDWWLVHLVAASVTIVLGEYLCSRRELEEIPMVDLFTKRPSRKN